MRLEIEPNVASLPLSQHHSEDAASVSDQLDISRLLKQGISAAQSGDRSLARTLLFKVTDADARCTDAWLWLASISEYPEELLGFLNNILEIDPENDRARQWESATRSLLARTFVQRGIAANDEGQPDFALQCFDKAISNDANCEMAWFWKASMAADEAERMEYLERVLSINPGNDEARKAVSSIADSHNAAKYAEAQAAAVAGNWKMAEDLVDQLLESDLSHLDAWMLRSHVSSSLEERLLAYDRILEIDPDNEYARSGHDFLVRTIEAVRPQPVTDEASSEPESVHFDDALAESVSVPVNSVGETGFANDLGQSEVADEPAPAMPADVAVQPSFEEEPLTATMVETIDNTESNSEADAEVSGKESAGFAHVEEFLDDPKPLSTMNGQHARDYLTDDELASELVADHYANAFAAQESNNNNHENPTEESYSLPHVYTNGSSANTDKVGNELLSETEVDVPSADFGNETDDRYATVEYSAEDTIPAVLEYSEPVPVEDVNAELASFSPFDHKVDAVETPFETAAAVPTQSCPYCGGKNQPLAFSCDSCHAVLSMSDIESLLGDTGVDRDAIQASVTRMEAEWNTREFNETELTTLGVGHFNLKNYESGLAYIQEASRLNPNNVILAGQLNAIAIRLDEMRRQNENHEAMPKGKTILVVDDSATVRKLISSKLEKCGHNVLTAVDGVEAMEVIGNVVPDLVLLDIAMPRMDGYSVCKLIRANDVVKDVPVVMISGKDGFFDKVRGRMAGTTGYITKPFGPETLMRALETYLLPDEAATHPADSALPTDEAASLPELATAE